MLRDKKNSGIATVDAVCALLLTGMGVLIVAGINFATKNTLSRHDESDISVGDNASMDGGRHRRRVMDDGTQKARQLMVRPDGDKAVALESTVLARRKKQEQTQSATSTSTASWREGQILTRADGTREKVHRIYTRPDGKRAFVLRKIAGNAQERGLTTVAAAHHQTTAAATGIGSNRRPNNGAHANNNPNVYIRPDGKPVRRILRKRPPKSDEEDLVVLMGG